MVSRRERIEENRKKTGNDSMKVDWLTPPEIVEALGPFDLDPATTCPMAHDGKPWATATQMLCRCTNGLEAPWKGRVWLNPPYERPLTQLFIQRLAEHGEGVALLMARTDSAWFHDWILGFASAIRFLRRRPHFYTPSGERMGDRATTASMLVSFGRALGHRLMDCKLDGKAIWLWSEES